MTKAFTLGAVLSRRRLLWTTGALALNRGAVAGPPPGVRLVVPLPPGGSGDAVGRLLAESMTRLLGTTVYVANVPGATGQRGATEVAHARSDGSALVLGNTATHAIAPALFPDLPYRPESDFAAIGQVCRTRLMLVVHPTFPARTLASAIAVFRAESRPLAYGSWGIGSAGHLFAEMIRFHSHVSLLHVPYQGVAPMWQGLLSGQILLAVSDVASALGLISAGKVMPLVVSGRERHAALPEVPTMLEESLPFPPDSWFALFAPIRTPAPVVARLQAALDGTLREPRVGAVLKGLALEPASLDGAAFARSWRDDIEAWRQVVLATGVSRS